MLRMSKNSVLSPSEIGFHTPRVRSFFLAAVGLRIMGFRHTLIQCFRKPSFAFVLLVLTSCGGSLSEDQRKKLREGIEEYKITQVSDAEIVTAAMDEGRSVFGMLEKVGFDASARIANERKVRIRFIK